MSRRAVPAAVALGAALMLGPGSAGAGLADVVAVDVQCEGRVCRFDVTVRHADTGWDHYANRFEVVAPDGTVIATRVLRHPHVKEQPFTRSLPGVRIPPGVDRVVVRAGDSVHGTGGAEIEVRIEDGA